MNNFKKILNLIKKTGDKMVVTDENGDSSFVVMPLDEYERIVEGSNELGGLSENELWNKVDRDIALWKQSHNDEFNDDVFSEPEKEPWKQESFERRDPFTTDDVKLPWEKEDDEDEMSESEKEFFSPELAWQKEYERETKEIEKPRNLDKRFPFELDDEDEDEKDESQFPERELQESKFSIPQERIKTQDFGYPSNEEIEKELEENTEVIKYEDIPAPPNLDVADIMKGKIDDDLQIESKRVIDMSFEDEDDEEVGFKVDEDDEESDFKEEAVF